MNREHIFISKETTDCEIVNQHNMMIDIWEVTVEQDFSSFNGFPASLVFTQIKKFMSKRYSEVAPERDSRKVIYCSFPYFGPASEAMSGE
jgi:hypothetical protein